MATPSVISPIVVSDDQRRIILFYVRIARRRINAATGKIVAAAQQFSETGDTSPDALKKFHNKIRTLHEESEYGWRILYGLSATYGDTMVTQVCDDEELETK